MLYSLKMQGVALGKRKTMADIGASVSSYFKAQLPESGQSII